jgi:hypothetical protein
MKGKTSLRQGCDHMIIGFTTTYAISAITTNVVSWNPAKRGVLDTTLCDKVCQCLATGWWFPPPIKRFTFKYIFQFQIARESYETMKGKTSLTIGAQAKKLAEEWRVGLLIS